MHDLLISAINLKEAPLLALVWMQKGRRKEEEEERKRKEGRYVEGRKYKALSK